MINDDVEQSIHKLDDLLVKVVDQFLLKLDEEAPHLSFLGYLFYAVIGFAYFGI